MLASPPMPFQFVNERTIEAIVGNQMKIATRNVGNADHQPQR